LKLLSYRKNHDKLGGRGVPVGGRRKGDFLPAEKDSKLPLNSGQSCPQQHCSSDLRAVCCDITTIF